MSETHLLFYAVYVYFKSSCWYAYFPFYVSDTVRVEQNIKSLLKEKQQQTKLAYGVGIKDWEWKQQNLSVLLAHDIYTGLFN